MDTKTIINEATDRMNRTVDHLDEELLNIRAGITVRSLPFLA